MGHNSIVQLFVRLSQVLQRTGGIPAFQHGGQRVQHKAHIVPVNPQLLLAAGHHLLLPAQGGHLGGKQLAFPLGLFLAANRLKKKEDHGVSRSRHAGRNQDRRQILRPLPWIDQHDIDIEGNIVRQGDEGEQEPAPAQHPLHFQVEGPQPPVQPQQQQGGCAAAQQVNPQTPAKGQRAQHPRQGDQPSLRHEGRERKEKPAIPVAGDPPKKDKYRQVEQHRRQAHIGLASQQESQRDIRQDDRPNPRSHNQAGAPAVHPGVQKGAEEQACQHRHPHRPKKVEYAQPGAPLRCHKIHQAIPRFSTKSRKHWRTMLRFRRGMGTLPPSRM